MILSSHGVFCVDEAWLPSNANESRPREEPLDPTVGDPDSERNLIESALTKSRGRVSGPNGAATQLRIHPSTLESRIKSLKIIRPSSSSLEVHGLGGP